MSETKTYTWDGNIQDVCALLRQAHDMLSLASYPSGFKRRWVGLTDEEREEIALEVPMDAVCITEAKLKEKNT